MKVIIYGLYDPRDGALRYVGKTIRPKTRLLAHIIFSRFNDGPKAKWIKELDKLDLIPEFKVLEEVNEETWAEAEVRRIAEAKAAGCDLLNIQRGGDSAPDWAGKHQTEEHIKKRVEARRTAGNYDHSEETKQKISEHRRGITAGSKNPFYGKTHSEEFRRWIKEHNKGMPAHNKGVPCSEETKAKISQTKRDHPREVTEETRQKLSQASRGRKLSSEHVEKLRQANLGKHPSEETKEKLRQASLGKHHTEETKEKLRQAFTGRKYSEETIQKMSTARKGKRLTPEQVKTRKRVQSAMWQDPEYRAKMLEAQRKRRERERAEKTGRP